MKHLNINVIGRVQGVFFRASAKEMADELNIKGFAKNMPNGSVYIEAEGDKESLDKFLKWCHIGPCLAQVEEVKAKQGDLRKFKGFNTE